MSLAPWIFTFPNSELETRDATRRIAAARPIPPQPRPKKHASLNGEAFQCGVVVRYAPPRAPPQWATRVIFVSRQQQWHSPHCKTHTLGRADAPTTGRLDRWGSRKARGGSHHSPGGKGRRRRGVLASRAAEAVGVGARRFPSGARKTTILVFLVENPYEAGSASLMQPFIRSNSRAIDRNLAVKIRYSVSDGPRGHCAHPSVPRFSHISRQCHPTSSRSS
jgi:hypothetical protein